MIPWKEVTAAIGKIFTLSQETQKNKTDIKGLDEKVDKLSRDVKLLETEITQSLLGLQRVYYETQRLQDEIRHLREDNERRDKDAARERENLILRLENQLLRAERGLPPPKTGEARD